MAMVFDGNIGCRGEFGYLNVLAELYHGIINSGFDRDDRTSVGTHSIFGRQIHFDLRKSFPLFTHKKVFMRGIFEELMWFLRGDTNIKTLLEKDVHIWSEWRYKAYLKDFEDKNYGRGLKPMTLKEFEAMVVNHPQTAAKFGDIGLGYGFQWRNFGETEVETVGHNSRGDECNVIARLDGFDQIKWVINEIKTNPTSRRLIVSGWNPHDMDSVDLPPCHTLFQFFVKDGELSCQLYQRSADMLLGVPFNVASYALLTHLVAMECGLKVGDFIWTGGDCHVYKNQLDGLKEIIHNRSVQGLPQIKINKRDSIFDYQWSDISIENYHPLDVVKMPVAV